MITQDNSGSHNNIRLRVTEKRSKISGQMSREKKVSEVCDNVLVLGFPSYDENEKNEGDSDDLNQIGP